MPASIALLVAHPKELIRAAANFLLHGVSQRELVTAIENAAAGKLPKGAGEFAKLSASMAAKPGYDSKGVRLTPRESQVLAHIALGLSNNEIAQSLDIGVETVKEHVQHLLRKLAVRDRTQAAVWAVQAGLV